MKNKLETIKIGKYEFKVPFGDLPHTCSEEEYANLKSDIKEKGIRVAIITDEYMNILDGVLRARICSELCLKDIPFTILPNLTDNDKREVAVTLNALRKAYSKEEKMAIAVTLRKSKCSYRRIAVILGVGVQTVYRWLNVNVSDETDEYPDTVIGQDGIERPAKISSPMILARSADEAHKSSAMIKESKNSEKLANKIIHANKQLEAELYKAEQKDNSEIPERNVSIGNAILHCGDFREICDSIPDESVDLVISDPPYDQESLILYEDMAKIAQRILKPNGVLLTYAGNLYINTIHKMLGEHLDYVWTFAAMHGGGNATCYKVNIYQTWKPILFYMKNFQKYHWKRFADKISGFRTKSHHKWEQCIDEAKYYIDALIPNKESAVILDPMCGSGTDILAGLELGVKQVIGIDVDHTAFATTQARVNDLHKKSAA